MGAVQQPDHNYTSQLLIRCGRISTPTRDKETIAITTYFMLCITVNVLHVHH